MSRARAKFVIFLHKQSLVQLVGVWLIMGGEGERYYYLFSDQVRKRGGRGQEADVRQDDRQGGEQQLFLPVSLPVSLHTERLTCAGCIY